MKKNYAKREAQWKLAPECWGGKLPQLWIGMEVLRRKDVGGCIITTKRRSLR